MTSFICPGVGEYDTYCEAGNPEIECPQCGEPHMPDRCPFADTCEHCSRTDAEMAESRLCVDCAEEIERIVKRDRRREDWAAYGDYLRDCQKETR
jgi:hypothetical protein